MFMQTSNLIVTGIKTSSSTMVCQNYAFIIACVFSYMVTNCKAELSTSAPDRQSTMLQPRLSEDDHNDETTPDDDLYNITHSNATEASLTVADIARMSVLWQAGMKMHQYYLPFVVPIGGVGNILSLLVSLELSGVFCKYTKGYIVKKHKKALCLDKIININKLLCRFLFLKMEK